MTEPASPPILPPFTEETARRKVQLAEDAWNTRDPDRVACLHRGLAVAQPRRVPQGPRRHPRLSVRFEYESRDVHGQWWRSHGNEPWEFDETSGLMRGRDASISDYRIEPSERRIALDDGHPDAAES